jgi:tape measure domain-containing protein
MDDATRLVISLEARTKAAENQLKKSAAIMDRQLAKIQKDFADANKKLVLKPPVAQGAGMTGMFGAARGIAGPLAAAASLRGAQELIDSATRIRNALRVAGLEGSALDDVYKQLFASAQRNAVPVESPVNLYGKLALTQKELGASSADLIKFSDNVALALRAGGTDAQAASGALLQLSQSLGGGVVRAEEMNSILEGAPTIALAAAAGLKEAGGSVAKLRQLVVDGDVSSQAFFRAFLAGASALEAKVSSSEATVSQAFVRLQNVLVDTAGKLDGATGASQKLAKFLSDDLAKAIQETGALLSGAGKGAGEFIGWLNKISDAIVGVASEAGQLSGLDEIGKALGATPYRSETLARTPEQIQNRIVELEQQLGGLANAARPFKDALQQQIDKLKEELSLIEQIGESQRLLTTSRAFGGTPGGGAPVGVVKPVSLSDYPVGAGGASGAAGKDDFAALTGAIRDFVDQVVRSESGGKANAKNPNSSATGLGQFIESTWLKLFKDNFPDRAKSMSDATILALRNDADISRSLIEAYAAENATLLRQAGVSVNAAALHLAHFLGPQGAIAVLTAKAGTPIAGLLSPGAIAANPTILGNGATVDSVRAYGERRAAAGAKPAGRSKQSPEQLFAGSVQDVEQRIALLNAEMEATRGLTAGVDDYGYALEKARIKQQLLNDAKAAGLKITPELAASIDTLAGNYARASANAEQLAASQQLSAEAAADFADTAKDVLGGFIRDLRDGKSASEALANALNKVGDRLLDVGLDALFGGGKGGGLGFLGSLLGFDAGGYTGAGPRKKPAGVVHKGEVVFSQDDVRRHGGVGRVESLRRGYEGGGIVGGGVPVPQIRLPKIPQRQQAAAAPSAVIRIDVTGAKGNTEVMDMVRVGVQQGLTQYDKVAKRTFAGRMAEAQVRDF